MKRAKFGRSAAPAFSRALKLAHADPGAPQPLCADRAAEFVDYEAQDTPSPELAARMCEGCPLLELCFENARRQKPYWGVLGGYVWVRGRRTDLTPADELSSILDTL